MKGRLSIKIKNRGVTQVSIRGVQYKNQLLPNALCETNNLLEHCSEQGAI